VYAGHPLPPAQTEKVITWFRRQQRGDGSFVAYPFASSGDLCATAAVWAAMRAAGVPESDDAVVRARRFVDANGGLEEVTHSFYTKTNFAALFVAMAGFIEPGELPVPPPGLVLNAPAERFLRKRFDYLNLVVGLVCAGAIVDDLRRRSAAAATAARAEGSFLGRIEAAFREAASRVGNAVESLDDDKAIAFLRTYQNPNGSLDDTSLQTAMLVAAYHALHLERDDWRLTAAVKWLRDMLVESPDEAWFNGFTGDVWSTALAGRALLAAGTPLDDPELAQTVTWFLDTQILDEKLVLSATRPGKPKIGGWAFEGTNVTTPDCDDTGLVLATLGMASDQAKPGDPGLPAPIAARLLTAVEKACAWLEGNQNPDGGWSAFDYWEGEKPRGPLYTHEIGLLSDDFLANLKNLVSPPIGLGSPAWEDVTGRVLFGIGWSGSTLASPVVGRAIQFLRNQQLDHGGWWGRWMVNYLPTTSCVLLGLSAVELPMSDPMVKRGIDFLLAHQNPDGGWGEDEETYTDPARAGRGPSMPPLTGLVLTALLDWGLGGSEAVQRGVEYLLQQQRPDGTWPNNEWLHAFFPPQSFYFYYMMPALYPLEALGRYREFLAKGTEDRGSVDAASRARAEALGHLDPGPPRSKADEWDDPFLDAMRLLGDPIADRVIKDLFAAQQTEAVNEVMKCLARSDEAVPAGLPTIARDYFVETAALPAWADPAQLEAAQRFFARVGWSVAAGLFCASLPQSYCGARGAKVLLYSGRLDLDARRRILETAQFVFDVTDEGGLSPDGRGVRSAQKVRLMHAALRHLVLQQARWDMADGLPINQEDLGATLMTFSTVILESLDRLAVPVSRDERAAWMHLWRVVGSLLGLDPDMIPVDEADGRALMDAVRRRHWSASSQGEMLGRALVECMQEYMPSPWLKRLPVTLVRHLAGDTCADLLGMNQGDWTAVLVDGADDLLVKFLRADRNQSISRVLERFSAELMKFLISVQRGGKRAPFRIPASLRST
jgi:squalene cyclase